MNYTDAMEPRIKCRLCPGLVSDVLVWFVMSGAEQGDIYLIYGDSVLSSQQSGRSTYKTNPGQNEPWQNEPWQNRPWAKRTLAIWYPGQNKPWSKRTLVISYPGHKEPWSERNPESKRTLVQKHTLGKLMLN